MKGEAIPLKRANGGAAELAVVVFLHSASIAALLQASMVVPPTAFVIMPIGGAASPSASVTDCAK